MSSFTFNDIVGQLKEITTDAGDGVSFANKMLKLDSEDDALEIAKAIKTCKNLVYLNLEGNTLGPNAAKVIAQALKENGSTLKRALWKDIFTTRLVSEIPITLEYLGSSLRTSDAQLYELDLSDNAFGPVGIKALANLLISKTCYTLNILRLNNNGLGISGAKILAEALLNCYENSSKAGVPPLALKVFNAGRNRLENEGAKSLASVFKKLTSLEEIVIPQNSIYYPGIRAIADGLSVNPKLRILNLNDNTLGYKGAKAIAKALPNLPMLEQLNLGDCLLKTQGSLVLTEALSVEDQCPLLSTIDFSQNEIRGRAVNSLANAMANKHNLVTLLLYGNSFGSKGRAILRNKFTNNMKAELLSGLKSGNNQEESEEDSDSDSETEEDTENSDEIEDEDEENEIDNKGIITNGKLIQSKVSVAEFLKSPTGEKLLLLQENTVQDFTDYAKNVSPSTDVSADINFIDEFTRIIMKVSALSTSGYSDVRTKAQTLTDILYSELCSLAVKNNQTCIWNNALLVNLGLIKGENKNSGKIDWNLEGCFKALETITQKDYFLQETRDVLKFFLEKPVKTSKTKTMIETFQDSRESLKDVLSRTQST